MILTKDLSHMWSVTETVQLCIQRCQMTTNQHSLFRVSGVHFQHPLDDSKLQEPESLGEVASIVIESIYPSNYEAVHGSTVGPRVLSAHRVALLFCTIELRCTLYHQGAIKCVLCYQQCGPTSLSRVLAWDQANQSSAVCRGCGLSRFRRLWFGLKQSSLQRSAETAFGGVLKQAF